MGSDNKVWHGSVVAELKPDGDLEIDSAHVGGFIRRRSRNDSLLIVVEHADVEDLLVAICRLMPDKVVAALYTAREWNDRTNAGHTE